MYPYATSTSLMSTPPSVTDGPYPSSSVVMPKRLYISTTFGTPTYSAALNAGMFSELPRAFRMLIGPWKLPLGFRGVNTSSPSG